VYGDICHFYPQRNPLKIMETAYLRPRRLALKRKKFYLQHLFSLGDASGHPLPPRMAVT
jgi:hypothetical protein